jgi:hypothetical protein
MSKWVKAREDLWIDLDKVYRVGVISQFTTKGQITYAVEVSYANVLNPDGDSHQPLKEIIAEKFNSDEEAEHYIEEFVAGKDLDSSR